MISLKTRMQDAVAAVAVAGQLDMAALVAEAHRQILAGLGLPDPSEDARGAPGTDLDLLFVDVSPEALVETVRRIVDEVATRIASTLAVAAAVARGDSLGEVGLRVAQLPDDE
ncbi:hypothetical protein [Frankia sp. CiP1_Cm_nod2]|uniref:hypothetical protein n=1 Tax=Frankia sp. CiP1_Cm_nod2 TaxID=2897161 RepID=UPI00202566EF